MNNLGQLIFNFRTGKNWSMQKFAEISGVSKSYVSKLENGTTGDNLSIDTLCKLSEIMKIDVMDLMEIIGRKRVNMVPESARSAENVIFANAVKNRREDLKLSQAELARMVGYKTKNTIERIESGGYNVTQSEISKLARALKTTPNALMGWTPKVKEEEEPLSSEEYILVDNYRKLNSANRRIVSNVVENSLNAQKITGQNVQGNSNIVAGGDQHFN